MPSGLLKGWRAYPSPYLLLPLTRRPPLSMCCQVTASDMLHGQRSRTRRHPPGDRPAGRGPKPPKLREWGEVAPKHTTPFPHVPSVKIAAGPSCHRRPEEHKTKGRPVSQQTTESSGAQTSSASASSPVLGAPGGGTDYNRSTWLDAMRGLGILLVVLGHAATGTNVWVYPIAVAIFAFHMPLLILVAGIAAWFSSPSGRIRIGRRALGLLVPYVAWVIVAAVALPGLPLGSSLRHIPGTLAVAALNPRAGGPWFLYVLFLLSLILWGISWLPGKTRRWAVVLAIGSLLAPHLGGIEPWTGRQVTGISLGKPLALFHVANLTEASHVVTASLTAVNRAAGILGWRNVVWFLPFFLAGFLLGPSHSRLEGSRWRVILGGSGLFAVSLALLWPRTPSLSWPNAWWLGPSTTRLAGGWVSEYVFVLGRYFASFAGIVLATGICGVSSGVFRRALARLGRVSLGIYLTHEFFLGWVTGTGLLATLLRFAVSLAMALLLTALFNESRLTAFVLLGRVPRAWRDLLAGLSVARVVFWLGFTAAGVALWLRHGWKSNLILTCMLVAAWLFIRWRRGGLAASSDPSTEQVTAADPGTRILRAS